MKTIVHTLLVSSFLLASCGAGQAVPTRPFSFGQNNNQSGGQSSGNFNPTRTPSVEQPPTSDGDRIGLPAATDFVAVPVEMQVPASAEGEQPVYIYLFTHTEDHINHELSEERYTRLAPVVADLAADHPDSGLVWTIEFMGADAQTVAERDPTTGVASMLRDYADQGYIDFGYHAHHEPTYMNRPQDLLDESSTWAELVEALDPWVSCEKDPLRGGCVASDGGGLLAVEDDFGPVQVVSGYSLEEGDVGITGGAGRHALLHHLPDYMVAFGFSDHSPASRAADFDALVNQLMDILTPTSANSEGLFWMDDALRLNDAAAVDSLGMLNLDNGVDSVQQTMETIERDHTQVMNAGFASKWIYTAQGSLSPTQYAYAHPDSPELPPESINPPKVIEKNYQANIAALDYLVTDFLASNPGSSFIGSEELLALAAPASYWQVTNAELDAIARWLLQEWGAQPSAYASDGVEFYSLRDATGLLAGALAENAGRGLFPAEQQLTTFYGPLAAVAPAEGLTLSVTEVYQIADQINRILAAGEDPWQVTPGNILPGSFMVSGSEINASQALYAMALVYASSHAGTPVDSVPLPTTQPVPGTYALLDGLGCWDCYDSAWSLKPATLH
ncbi:MAG: hypothetical protein WD751_04445 [Anaerolineales bacterium]